MRKLILVLMVLAVVGLVAGCTPKPTDPTCHIVPDPEFGYPTCRWY